MIFSRNRSAQWIAAVLVCLFAVFGAGCRGKKYENPITKDTEQPDKVLFDKAVKDIERGRYEVARLTLNTLMNTYDTSEFLAKSKLAIADSWMREGGTHAFAQAEAEYKDFILFYPTLEESAEAQMKVCDIHYKQMEKPDRDPTHVMRAEEECRTLLTNFPNSRYAPEAAQRLRDIQEVSSEGEFRVGAFYHHKGSFPAAANRLQTVTDHYPLYSGSDQALWLSGDSYSHMGPRFKQKSVSSYQKIVRDYPLSPLVDQAKDKLKEMEAEIPEPDPVAYARMKYELENQAKKGMMGKAWAPFSKDPDVTAAAKSGQPAMTTLRPSIPASVPVPAGAQGGVNDITISTNPTGGTSQLDTQPDARATQPAAAGSAPAATPQAAPPAANPNEMIPTNHQMPVQKKGKQKKAPKQDKKKAEAATTPAAPEEKK
ncbi:outer membrane protein assembly factor BamD [Paludibaculum fermentans]|uniref:outer membrane protein assembly factor BamD n=1 Tax=Paludibaculum fermentans TaxID=1473598 RepID=UPI003EBF2400